MNSLIRFIVKYHFALLFLALESFSLWILANHTYYQHSKFENATRTIEGYFSNRIDRGRQYLKLRATNEQLAKENLDLRNQLSKLSINLERLQLAQNDTLSDSHYLYIPARVVNNSVNKQNNFLTINVGKLHGVEQEMGVVTNNGIVGIVAGVSEHYSTVISLLNVELKVSAKLKRSHYFGSLFWNGRDYREVLLTEIPQHVALNVGDTIITSGFSAIFPPNINLATIKSFDTKAGNFYTIRASLLCDFKQLNHVWVVKNLHEKESEMLDKKEE
ncbi:MAG: rod shape-determining protein MreC [Tenuifilaceae bacterium]|jgi:rod shape-determining protein MreC|nr:rod shape-determining protein MreC [Bacteroidales bacterium]MDI9516799.1 rod shape-determining protein MreC [Bacteroidota bacterium]NLH55709.1 rod shape-determining protein MreC [Rikenellaceae bacterium]OQC63546.1 MAG: Cell shape-determining protein MreC precursor [Bacteroidetes bacterium ADurb.Bin008]HOF92368.1 rod shape-determining protein MreC [Tenuifilaceae bacterium]